VHSTATAQATFHGTDRVAALTFRPDADGSLTAVVVGFEVPPGDLRPYLP
jgi:hypothetical protein